MAKIISWVLVNGATLLGVSQTIVKALKELATGVINLLSLFVKAEKAKKAVEVVRGLFNKVDDGIEFVKKYLIK